MKKIYLLLLLVAGFAEAQIVNIPDVNFKARLLSSSTSNAIASDGSGAYLKIDANGDGEIAVTEAQVVVNLNVSTISDPDITSLTGIAAFTNLKSLNCALNTITAINTADLAGLEIFDCSENQITSLDLTPISGLLQLFVNTNPLSTLNLTGLGSLQTLNCSDTQLSGIDLTQHPSLRDFYSDGVNWGALDATVCPLLEILFCRQCQLTSLNVAGLVKLDQLECSSNNIGSLALNDLPLLRVLFAGENQLAAVDTSNLPSLVALTCNSNAITALDLTNNPGLFYLDCHNNQLSSLDLSQNPFMDTLICSQNNLTYLNLQNGSLIVGIVDSSSMANNPNLAFICIDEDETDFVLQHIASTGSPSIVFNTYCSFTPGGLYNTITGKITIDTDNNGCDLQDAAYPYLRIDINDGTLTGSNFTDADGNYAFYTQSGSFTVTPNIENQAFFTLSPSSDSVTFPEIDQTVATHNFCIRPNGIHPDLEVILTADRIRPGFNTYQNLIYRNKGNQQASGTATYTFDETVLEFISANPAPDSQSANTLTWNYTALSPFETRGINLVLRANAPTDTPPLNSGNQLVFSATINPVSGDETPADNIFTNNIVAVNSFDPNDKTCLEGSSILPENIGKYLHYNINFENTGTADAINVVVKDTIDTTRFDINSLQLLYASHPVYTKITGNVVEFIFDGINLPPSIMNPIGGHGNVLFKIKTLDTLSENDQVTNTANIYFDYNHPVVTNEARTAFTNLSRFDFVKDNSVSVYPNPVKNKVTVKAVGIIQSVRLHDAQGRILQTAIAGKNQITLDLSSQQTGVYFLTVTTQKGSSTQKIIKQ